MLKIKVIKSLLLGGEIVQTVPLFIEAGFHLLATQYSYGMHGSTS